MPDDKPAAKKRPAAKKKKSAAKPVVVQTPEEVLATEEAEPEVSVEPSVEVESVEEALPDEQPVGGYDVDLIRGGKVVTVRREKGESLARKAKPLMEKDRRH